MESVGQRKTHPQILQFGDHLLDDADDHVREETCDWLRRPKIGLPLRAQHDVQKLDMLERARIEEQCDVLPTQLLSKFTLQGSWMNSKGSDAQSTASNPPARWME